VGGRRGAHPSASSSDRGRAAGLTVPVADVLVFACAKIHGVDLAHDDRHFDELAKLEG
jgi:predicted nucleic acid-binding protein